MSTKDLATIEDELYGLPLKEFTAARDALASDARQVGDRDLASSVKRLRKPAVAAWLANMLVRDHRKEIERLIGLGESLRSSRSMKGESIREASKQKAALVGRLLRHAKAIADQANQPASEAVLRDLEASLDAAFSDPESAATLRAGHLSATLQYSGLGFGGAPAPRSPATTSRPGNGGTPRASKSTAMARRALEQASREAVEAEKAADGAKRAVVSAEADLKRLRATFAVADRKAKKARERLSAAQKKVDTQRSAGKR
jgi:NADH dehydrogenase/NADH:ubiquinone oxidoreductase subunit G